MSVRGLEPKDAQACQLTTGGYGCVRADVLEVPASGKPVASLCPLSVAGARGACARHMRVVHFSVARGVAGGVWQLFCVRRCYRLRPGRTGRTPAHANSSAVRERLRAWGVAVSE